MSRRTILPGTLRIGTEVSEAAGKGARLAPSAAKAAAGAVAAALALAGCASPMTREPPWLQESAAVAQNPQEHRNRASEYEAQASTLLLKAALHDRQALAYGPPTAYARLENDLARHCLYVASLYRELAESNLRLARLHQLLYED